MIDIVINDINEHLRLIQSRIVNIRPVLSAIAEILATSFEENFRQGGRWDGVGTGFFAGGNKRWKPLSGETKERYKRLGYSRDRTLKRTAGGLAASIEVRPQGLLSVAISANKVYASIHQHGGEINPIIPVTPAMRKYFWARYYGTGQEKYKWMALTKKTTFTPHIKIPASPYLVIQQEDIEDIRDVLLEYHSPK